jgi:hypothetical protein
MTPKPAGERYVIKIEGLMSPDWVDWPCQVQTEQETDESGIHAITILTATMPDQTALHGLLEKIRDLNLKLISFERLE